MKDSLGQEAKVGDLILYSHYSQGNLEYGIVSKVTPSSITFITLCSWYSRSDYRGNAKTELEMYTETTSRKMSSNLFTIINPLLDAVLALPSGITDYKTNNFDKSITMGDAYEVIRNHLRL